MSGTSVVGAFGYFGKVPDRGDFITDHLPADFVAGWGEWLQAVMAVSREQLGDDWLDCYLTSPLWHFALSPGACGEAAMCGTLMPSVDQIGRHYFFTLAAELATTPVAAWEARHWSRHTEAMALQVLEDGINLAHWAKQLHKARWLPEAQQSALTLAADGSEQLAIDGEEALHPLSLLHQAYGQRHDRYCLWWTSGSERVAPTTLVTAGLPLVSQFAAMLDGDWRQWGW